MSDDKFLFEVSWEVCNKVGGIHTVLRSKLGQVVSNFGNNYLLIGPWRGQNQDFIESSTGDLNEIKKILAEKNIIAHVGYWKGEEKPKVILVDFKDRYKIDALLYLMWVDFGVDSLASNYDYHEPILFATAAGEIIDALSKSGLASDRQIIAHFHEWMCGAGLLYLKKHNANIATVFTTHATVLGRALAQDNRLTCTNLFNFNADDEARKHGIFAKHSLEKISAKEADCFTTVSKLVANEANVTLGKYPDSIVYNGIDFAKISKKIASDQEQVIRYKLLKIASKVVSQNIGDDSLIWLTSGRYEFHNKGFDLLLKALAKLEDSLTENMPRIVVFILVAATWHGKQDTLLDIDPSEVADQQDALGIATHKVYNPASDNILRLCNELNLKNPNRRVHIIFSDAYLNGSDGVFDLSYEQILASSDLTIFPSFYEPWGYTPLESIAYSTPTITTDLAGFGDWVGSDLYQDYSEVVLVLKRKEQDELRSIADLSDYLLAAISKHGDLARKALIRSRAVEIAANADWRVFYPGYIEAYAKAIQFNKLSKIAAGLTDSGGELLTIIQDGMTATPRMHALQYECELPTRIQELRKLAYNFWWSWHADAQLLFKQIDPDLWKKCDLNPVYFLNLVSAVALERASVNDAYLNLYDRIIKEFKEYINTDCDSVDFCQHKAISSTSPIAYFCMEYGIDECLPIYSGGLGILAGDYLKAMSDLHIPVVAVGLFYKEGYFLQHINYQGEQEAVYESWDIRHIPMALVNDASGKEVVTSLELLGRTIYIRAWEVKVGHISLYLLDTDLPENLPSDREITDSLYGGSREIRLMQEMVLGIGGTRFLLDKLGIKPAIYHLNEGHSAFLLLERIRYFSHQGFSFDEAVELVRSSSVFTTHTPVVAGNEMFSEDLARKYLESYAGSRLGISFDRLFTLAEDRDMKGRVFSMTALALRLTAVANAVSNLHGVVARDMWRSIWPGLLSDEIPIGVVTNGVHLATWLGKKMHQLYDSYLPANWVNNHLDNSIWQKVAAIPDGELWGAHQEEKIRLIDHVKQTIVTQYTLRNEGKRLINSSLKALSKDTLLIGISRRFTSYKRNNLFLLDVERLARILNDEKFPVVILVAGKAHPADSVGMKLIHEIMLTLRRELLNGHIIFLEEYNIGLAKLLVHGVDLWLNTPILGREACGTSGMKVAINGGLNFSTADGWWHEAYSEKIGWQIASMTAVGDLDERADVENSNLIDTLEMEVIPLYYRTNHFGYSSEWLAKMKASMAFVAERFNAFRMAQDYANRLYTRAVDRNEQLVMSSCRNLKAVAAWQQSIAERFHTLKIKAVFINGIKNGKITSHGLVQIKVLLYVGKMAANELQVEMVLLKDKSEDGIESKPVIIKLKDIEGDLHDPGVLNYIAEYQINDPGFYSYGIRILPYNRMLFNHLDAKLVYWG